MIGGGAVGVCAAFYLHRAGLSVTLLERGDICSGSSHGNAGLIVPSHSIPLAAPGVIEKGMKWMFDPESPFYIKPRMDPLFIKWLWQFWRASRADKVKKSIPLIRDLSLKSLALFEEINQLDTLNFDFEKRGLLMLYNDPQGLEDGKAESEQLQKFGLETTYFNYADVSEMISPLAPAVLAGIQYEQDAHLTPGKFVRQLADYLEREGVEVRTQTEVIGFGRMNDRITEVETTRGNFSSDQVVISAGSSSPLIGDLLNIDLPIQPAKGYSITISRPPSWPEIPMVLSEAKVAVTPMGNTLRFGGTLELAGSDPTINQVRIRAILKAVSRYFPDFTIDDDDILEIWRGMRPCTPDGLPFLGRSSKYNNVIVAAGHAMIGVSLAPVTGEIISQLVNDAPINFDMSALSVERFDV